MNPNTSQMVRPKFKITLTAEETLEVGRLCVIWGQIDHFVFGSISALLTKDMAAGTDLMSTLTTGPLVNLLNKARHRIRDEAMREKVAAFCKDMGPLIEKRNHLMHGIWGLHLPSANPDSAIAGCLYLKAPKKPLFPKDVTKLANDAAQQTYVIAEIWHHIHNVPLPDGYPQFYFGQHEPSPPKGTKLTPLAQPPKGHPT